MFVVLCLLFCVCLFCVCCFVFVVLCLLFCVCCFIKPHEANLCDELLRPISKMHKLIWDLRVQKRKEKQNEKEKPNDFVFGVDVLIEQQ